MSTSAMSTSALWLRAFLAFLESASGGGDGYIGDGYIGDDTITVPDMQISTRMTDAEGCARFTKAAGLACL
jgi:hypothetical protein